MDDDLLTLAAIVFELGLPVLLGLVAAYSHRLRRAAVSILGAVSPMLLGYLMLAVSFVADPESAGWAFSAVWVMSFMVYGLMSIIGLGLGVWRRPTHVLARYFLAAAVASSAVGALLLSEEYLV